MNPQWPYSIPSPNVPVMNPSEELQQSSWSEVNTSAVPQSVIVQDSNANVASSLSFPSISLLNPLKNKTNFQCNVPSPHIFSSSVPSNFLLPSVPYPSTSPPLSHISPPPLPLEPPPPLPDDLSFPIPTKLLSPTPHLGLTKSMASSLPVPMESPLPSPVSSSPSIPAESLTSNISIESPSPTRMEELLQPPVPIKLLPPVPTELPPSPPPHPLDSELSPPGLTESLLSSLPLPTESSLPPPVSVKSLAIPPPSGLTKSLMSSPPIPTESFTPPIFTESLPPHLVDTKSPSSLPHGLPSTLIEESLQLPPIPTELPPLPPSPPPIPVDTESPASPPGLTKSFASSLPVPTESSLPSPVSIKSLSIPPPSGLTKSLMPSPSITPESLTTPIFTESSSPPLPQGLCPTLIKESLQLSPVPTELPLSPPPFSVHTKSSSPPPLPLSPAPTESLQLPPVTTESQSLLCVVTESPLSVATESVPVVSFIPKPTESSPCMSMKSTLVLRISKSLESTKSSHSQLIKSSTFDSAPSLPTYSKMSLFSNSFAPLPSEPELIEQSESNDYFGFKKPSFTPVLHSSIKTASHTPVSIALHPLEQTVSYPPMQSTSYPTVQTASYPLVQTVLPPAVQSTPHHSALASPLSSSEDSPSSVQDFPSSNGQSTLSSSKQPVPLSVPVTKPVTTVPSSKPTISFTVKTSALSKVNLGTPIHFKPLRPPATVRRSHLIIPVPGTTKCVQNNSLFGFSAENMHKDYENMRIFLKENSSQESLSYENAVQKQQLNDNELPFERKSKSRLHKKIGHHSSHKISHHSSRRHHHSSHKERHRSSHKLKHHLSHKEDSHNSSHLSSHRKGSHSSSHKDGNHHSTHGQKSHCSLPRQEKYLKDSYKISESLDYREDSTDICHEAENGYSVSPSKSNYRDLKGHNHDKKGENSVASCSKNKENDQDHSLGSGSRSNSYICGVPKSDRKIVEDKDSPSKRKRKRERSPKSTSRSRDELKNRESYSSTDQLRRNRFKRRRSSTPKDLPCLSPKVYKYIKSTPATKYYSSKEESKEVAAKQRLMDLHDFFKFELVDRTDRIRALKPKYEPPKRKTKLRKPKSPKAESNSDSSSSEKSSSSEEEDTAMEELERKKKHPDRLHLELWFNDPKEMNDGPLCRCSAKSRRAGIRHGIYVGEDHLPLCDPFTNNPNRLHHYRITMTPHTNFLTKNPTTIRRGGHEYRFEGFSMFSHFPLPQLPNCKVIRFNYEYTIMYTEEEFPKNFTIQGLELFNQYLLMEILELVDLNWKAYGDVDGCPRFHFMPRFTRELEDGGKEILSHAHVLEYLLRENQILIEDNKLSEVLSLEDCEWQYLADEVKGMIVTCPGMKPSSIRVDQLDREQCEHDNEEFPVIVHFGVRPPQLSYAGNPHYQKAWRDYVKYRHLLANKPKVKYVDRHRLNQKESRLQAMRMENDLKRDVTVVISSKNFYKTGIMSDVIQHAMLLPVLVCHLRFHQSLAHLEEKLGYKFQDRFLLQLALTHPSYRENFGTNPDHARNSLTNCGLRQPQYGDRRIHYMNTRKRGINTLINIMSRFGSRKETLSRINHNERLEFLGDAVVEFLSSIHLFYMFPDLEEGGLATYRAAIVQNQHLAVLSKKLELDRFMLYAHGSDLCHDLELRHAMANCFEALMGALFLDNGIEVADKVFSRTLFHEPELLDTWSDFSLHPLQEQEPDGDRKWIASVPLLQKLNKFEDTIGIEFTHIRLLARALTHRSLGYNNLTLGSNQRLEFLGDTVLQLVASEYLYKFFPEHHEGHLSLLRSSLVNNRTQAVVCADLGMVEYAIYPYSKVELKPKDKADLLEAFLGALYVDKDLGYCRQFCEVCFFPRLQDFIMNQDWNDPKSKLQQCCLTLRSMDGGEPDIPTYKVIECKGPTNTRVYSVAVYFQSNRLAVGSGHSIQQAEMDAAYNALKKSKDLFPQLKHQRRAIERSLKQGPPKKRKKASKESKHH